MKAEEFAQLIDGRLRPLARTDQALQMRAYLRNQFEFLGIAAPVRREAVKDLLRLHAHDAQELVNTARLLWQKPEREFRYTAIDLLRLQSRYLRAQHLPSIRDLLLMDPWWETVDGLTAVVGMVVRADLAANPKGQQIMDDWLTHPNFWVRRCAMLHQLGWRLDTDSTRLSHYALRMADEKEFFIRKAIGWTLRDYARWNPEFVQTFIRNHRQSLSNLTVREACKHLVLA